MVIETAKILKEHNIRPSFQRTTVLQYLKSVKTHPTVDEIYQALQPNNPSLSRTTVYNTLELLAQNNLVLTLDFGEGFLRYDGDCSPHSHFKCRKCGLVYDIFVAPPNYESLMPKGFKLEGSSLYLFGKCKKCCE